eukprot:1195583-Prorocentrum_minimum.AAC.7
MLAVQVHLAGSVRGRRRLFPRGCREQFAPDACRVEIQKARDAPSEAGGGRGHASPGWQAGEHRRRSQPRRARDAAQLLRQTRQVGGGADDHPRVGPSPASHGVQRAARFVFPTNKSPAAILSCGMHHS